VLDNPLSSARIIIVPQCLGNVNPKRDSIPYI
jgi:hypothetical protein